jgi:hypothetical protein
MDARHLAAVATLLAMPVAQAQERDTPAAPLALLPATAPELLQPALPSVLLPRPAPTLSSTPPLSRPFAGIQPIPRGYMRNEAEPDRIPRDPAAFGRWVTDPRLLAGVRLTPFLALEAGYVNLYDRGTYFVDYREASGAADALNLKGFNSHVAARLTVPVGDRLEAFGKAGVAASEFRYRDDLGRAIKETDVGPYVGAGAKYKVSGKASVSGSVERYGNSDRWGPNTNNNALKAKVNLGF